MKKIILLLFFFISSKIGFAADTSNNKSTQDNISNYLVDVTGGAISAGGLAGVSSSAITEIQTSQDIIVALKPLTSSSSSKDGFGFAITPFRTTITPMSKSTYSQNIFTRSLGSTTLSYAENSATVADVKFAKTAASIDFSAYFFDTDDPLIISQDAVTNEKFCPDRRKLQDFASLKYRENRRATAALATALEQSSETLVKMKKDYVDAAKKAGKTDAASIAAEEVRATSDHDAQLDALRIASSKAEDEQKKAEDASLNYGNTCIDNAIASIPWNASRWSLSAGTVWAKLEDGTGPRLKAGHYLTLNVLMKASKQGAIYALYRKSRDEIDLKTFSNKNPSRSNASLSALRYTYGSKDDNGNLKGIIEISNAKGSSATVSNTVYKHAIGVDKKIAAGLWLELRVGRNETFDGKSLQTTGLCNLSIAPTAVSTLFGK